MKQWVYNEWLKVWNKDYPDKTPPTKSQIEGIMDMHKITEYDLFYGCLSPKQNKETINETK